MKVFVSGADGFIGSHLTELLLKHGFTVKALSQYNSFNFHGWLEGINHPKLEIISGDIRDPYFCRKATEDCEIVFHLAALIAIPYSYIAPQSYVETNVNGTLNICEAALINNIKKIVITSTSEVYGTAIQVPINESHPKQPQSPYSASKIGADMIALSYFHSFQLPVIVARPFNTYGPRQSARAVIPTIISQIAAGSRTINIGDSRPTRDFTFVKDTCTGLFKLAECDEAIGKEVNIASKSEISIANLAQKIASKMNVSVKFETDSQRLRPEKSEVFRLFGDNSKLFELTGFSPEISLDSGIDQTIEWFSDANNLSKYKTQIYNI